MKHTVRPASPAYWTIWQRSTTTHYLQVVPFTANDVGAEFVALFQLPVNPIPE
jgi:hypothetical protein